MNFPVKAIISFVIAIIATIYVAMNLLPSTTNTNVALEDINFAVNNTYYDIANTPIVPDTAVIYAYNNITFPYTSSQVSITSTQAKIYANGTGNYPNVTVGHHYLSYTYYAEAWIGGGNYSWMVSILMFILAFALIYLALTKVSG